VAALAFLILGMICALIGRVLLVTAAWQISAAWAIGVFLPFGPVLFRLNYPDQALRSRMFRLATLPCFFLYLVLGPGPAWRHQLTRATNISLQPTGYATEKHHFWSKQATKPAGPKVELTPSVEERRLTNSREFEKLRTWDSALRLKKRDLLHSDTAGNQAYALELEQYQANLQKATAERTALWPKAH
jgi:hypothetical protein